RRLSSGTLRLACCLHTPPSRPNLCAHSARTFPRQSKRSSCGHSKKTRRAARRAPASSHASLRKRRDSASPCPPPAIVAAPSRGLIGAGIAAYLSLGNRWFATATTGEAIIDAQQSVTTALALVELLPKDHPLRSYSANLREWQGELKVYAQANHNDPQVTQRVERYRQQADDIAGQTRAALAALGREVPANI